MMGFYVFGFLILLLLSIPFEIWGRIKEQREKKAKALQQARADADYQRWQASDRPRIQYRWDNPPDRD